MKLEDNAKLRDTLLDFFPGFDFIKTAAPSGQRVVYFGRFLPDSPVSEQAVWSEWGQVVLKVSAGLSAKSIAYLQKEAATLREMDSDSFPALLFEDLFSENPVSEEKLNPKLYVTVEECIESSPLTTARDQYRTEREILGLLRKLVAALKSLWLHKNGFVHRDLKPDNILIRPDGKVSIIDLGIIREAGEKGLTLTIADWGPCTPCYASPEQVKNDKLNISFRSDLFSLGVIAYELAAGSNPFADAGDSVTEVFDKVLSYDPPSLTDKGFSCEFSDVVIRLIGKEPYQRFRRVELLESELDRLLWRDI